MGVLCIYSENFIYHPFVPLDMAEQKNTENDQNNSLQSTQNNNNQNPPNTQNNNQDNTSQTQIPKTQKQPAQSQNEENLMKPQQQQMQNQAQRPVEQSQKTNPTSNSKDQSSKKPQKKQEKEMSSYEKRFRSFIKSHFGGMIGDMLLDEKLSEMKVQDISMLDEKQQMMTMETIITDIFQKHNMQESKEHTILELKLQLCLDKAIALLKEELQKDNIEIDQLEVEHHNAEVLERYAKEGEEEITWGSSFKAKGSIEGKGYLFTHEKQISLLISDFAKAKKIEFNAQDEKQKFDMFYKFAQAIFNNYMSVVKEMLGYELKVEFEESKVADINLVDDIREEIAKMEKDSGHRINVISAEFAMSIGRQKFSGTAIFLDNSIQLSGDSSASTENNANQIHN